LEHVSGSVVEFSFVDLIDRGDLFDDLLTLRDTFELREDEADNRLS
jgi:hypothetical protein